MFSAFVVQYSRRSDIGFHRDLQEAAQYHIHILRPVERWSLLVNSTLFPWSFLVRSLLHPLFQQVAFLPQPSLLPPPPPPPHLAPGTNPILFVCTTAYFIFCPESSFDFNINSSSDFLSPDYQSTYYIWLGSSRLLLPLPFPLLS